MTKRIINQKLQVTKTAQAILVFCWTMFDKKSAICQFSRGFFYSWPILNTTSILKEAFKPSPCLKHFLEMTLFSLTRDSVKHHEGLEFWHFCPMCHPLAWRKLEFRFRLCHVQYFMFYSSNVITSWRVILFIEYISPVS